jgi:hypothetical protein
MFYYIPFPFRVNSYDIMAEDDPFYVVCSSLCSHYHIAKDCGIETTYLVYISLGRSSGD